MERRRPRPAGPGGALRRGRAAAKLPPMARGRSSILSERRAARLGPVLARFADEFDAAPRLRLDPLEVPRRYRDPGDAEVAGLLAACLAYGRADLFKPRLEQVLAVMGPSPAAFAEAFAAAPAPQAFAGFRYRFNRPEDVAALVAAAGFLRRRHGSLGDLLAGLYRQEAGSGAADPLRRALGRFVSEIRTAPPVAPLLRRRGRRGLHHLCPDPRLPGACKRWNLYLRWMVRGPDGVDLGLWRGIPPAALVIPLDTHVLRVSRRLGLTGRRDATWRTAEEITGSLRRVDARDPVRFDFALCHLGMSGACPPRPDAERCQRCALRPVCRSPARAAGAQGARPSSAGG